MRNLLLRFIVTSIAILAVAKLLPGIEVNSLFALIMTVVILGILNAFLRPIMVIITLPITVVTLGLFLFIIYGIIHWRFTHYLIVKLWMYLTTSNVILWKLFFCWFWIFF